MSGKINVPQCPKCGADLKEQYYRYCRDCNVPAVMAPRDKKRISDDFVIVDWFSSRSSAGLIVEDSEDNRYEIYMSDLFSQLDGMRLGSLTIEEVKKGSAYGWRVLNEKGSI